MAPGPSAWRLNKAEQGSVNEDLEKWAGENEDLRLAEPDEFKRKKEEEKKRLTRVIQEEKHNRNLQKQGKAGAKAKAKPDNEPLGLPVRNVSSELPGHSNSGINEAYFQSLQNDMKTIVEHLGDLKAESPVPISDSEKGGIQDRVVECQMIIWFLNFTTLIFQIMATLFCQEPYNAKDALAALQSQSMYISACNLMWLDLFRVSNPAVPLCRQRVEELGEFHFGKKQTFMKTMLEVAVVQDQMTNVPGGLQMISPEELAHAVVFSCAKRLRAKDCTKAEKAQWKLTLFFGWIN